MQAAHVQQCMRTITDLVERSLESTPGALPASSGTPASYGGPAYPAPSGTPASYGGPAYPAPSGTPASYGGPAYPPPASGAPWVDYTGGPMQSANAWTSQSDDLVFNQDSTAPGFVLEQPSGTPQEHVDCINNQVYSEKEGKCVDRTRSTPPTFSSCATATLTDCNQSRWISHNCLFTCEQRRTQ
jgi:hypothetical protein